MLGPVRVEQLPERHVAVVHHHGSAATVDQTRRPLYRHMVINELVGGPSLLRWLEPAVGDRVVDALVTTHPGFEGDAVCRTEALAAGRYAVADYEGAPEGLGQALKALRGALATKGLRPAGPVLQVHLMDAVEGVTEQQFQVPLRP